MYHKNKQLLNQIKRLKRWKDDINYVLKNLKPNPNQSLPNLEKVGFEATQRRYCEDVFGDSERAEAAQVILKFIQQEMRLFDRMVEASHFANHPKGEEFTFENGLKTSHEYTKQKQKHVLASSKALSEMASLGLQAAFCELNDLVVTRAYIRLLKKANTEALKSNVLSRLF